MKVSMQAALVAAALAVAGSVEARITRLEITRTESPTFGGRVFGDAGRFEKVIGVAHGEVDPRDPLNAIIQDIQLAPRNARGMVEYSTDFYIIKPVDMSKGNRMLFYNVHNRGNNGGLSSFNIGVVGGNEPTDAGDGFLQEMGYTIIWSGWQPDVAAGGGRMTGRVPVPPSPAWCGPSSPWRPPPTRSSSAPAAIRGRARRIEPPAPTTGCHSPTGSCRR